MIRKMTQRVMLGLFLLASSGAAQAAPWGTLPSWVADDAHVHIRFDTTYYAQDELGQPSPEYPIAFRGLLAVTAEAYRNGFEFWFHNTGSTIAPLTHVILGPGAIDETNGLLNILVTIGEGARPQGVDLAYMRDVQIGPVDSTRWKEFALRGGEGQGLSGTFTFDDSNYSGGGRFMVGELGVHLTFSGQDFAGWLAGHGIGCHTHPCFIAGQTSIAVPAPAGLAFLALGMAGLAVVRRRAIV